MPPGLVVRAILLGLLLFQPGPVPLAKPPSSTIYLTILHTNDTHGHLAPFSYPETFDTGSDLARLPVRRNIGGIARRARLAARVRREPNRHALLVDSGDFCDGSPFSTEYHGEADAAAMRAAGYDLACPGNHEFNNTVAEVDKLRSMVRYPVLCANVTVRATGKPLYTPYVIKQIGSARVAFFGLLTAEAGAYPAGREGLAVASPIETASRLVPVLRRQADIVVALTHIGIEEDRRLATAVDGINVIVGGHSHTLLPRPILIANAPDADPLTLDGTVIAQDFQWGGTLGRLDLTLRKSSTGRWVLNRCEGRLLPVTSTTPEDPRVAAVVRTYWKPIAGRYGTVIGRAAGDFAQKGDDAAEYNLVADALRWKTGTQFDLENIGGVRAPLPKGPITYGDIATLDPFTNTVVTFRVAGRDLKRLLRDQRPAVSGIRYEVRAGRLTWAKLGGRPIQDDEVYRGSANSFLAAQSGFDMVTDKADTGIGRRQAIIDYIRQRRVVAPAYDGRRKIR